MPQISILTAVSRSPVSEAGFRLQSGHQDHSLVNVAALLIDVACCRTTLFAWCRAIQTLSRLLEDYQFLLDPQEAEFVVHLGLGPRQGEKRATQTCPECCELMIVVRIVITRQRVKTPRWLDMHHR